MTKKIILFLIVLFLGISWGQTVFAAPTISAYLSDNFNCSHYQCVSWDNNNNCNYWLSPSTGSLNIAWYKTPALGWTSGEIIYLGGTPQGGTGRSPLPNAQQGTYEIYGPGVKCGGTSLPVLLNYAFYVCSDFNGQRVCSDLAQFGPPPPPSLSSTTLVSPDKLTLTKDPVNIATGEDYFSSTDFALSARGPKLALSRKYRSLSTFSGMFGYGWRTDFDVNLTQDNAGDVIIYDGQGTGIYFMNNAGAYVPSPGNYFTITKNKDNTFTLTDKNGIATHYDINGRLSTRTDRNGNVLSFIYNPAQVGGTYIQDAGGRQIKLYFDVNNHVISAKDPAGHAYQYGYDVNGNLVSITDPTAAVTNYNYDANHKIVQMTNANGHKTHYQYDGQGRATMTWQDNNVNKTTLDYQPSNTTVVTDSLGNKNTYVFNPSGLEISRTDPLKAVTQQTWDADMNLLSRTDARNNVTSFAYDGKGNLLQTIDPLNNQTKMAYTPDFNLIASSTDALSNVTNFAYDNKGNLTSITDALGKTHTFVYDQSGNATTAADSHGTKSNFSYDAYGNLLQKADAYSDKTIFTYDADGNILTQKDALQHVTNFQYDKLNRLIKTTFADNSKVTYAYDLFGNPISTTDQRGNVLTKTYDAYERLAQTKDPLGGITQFNYDTEGHLLTLTDANGHTTTYTYDSNGRVLTQTNALNFATTFTYDPAGNLASKTDANGKTTKYTYDALNRLTNTAYPNGTSVANVYDAINRKISMTDARGQTTYTYDVLNRLLTKKTPGANNTITYTYDSEGNRLTSVDQNNRTIANTYDAMDRLTSVNGAWYAYDGVSNVILDTRPNKVTEKYTYDVLNRKLTGVASGGKFYTSFTNVYDVAGMIIKKTFADGSTETYTYDALNRLLSEAKDPRNGTDPTSNVYTYDAVGNRLTWTKNNTLRGFWGADAQTMPPQVLTNMAHAGYGRKAFPMSPVTLVRKYTYDAANRLVNWKYTANVWNVAFPAQMDTYTYDGNGNRLTKQAVLIGQEGSPQQTSYGYDFENRLNTLSYLNILGIKGNQTDSFTYSGEGLRTQVVANNVTSAYLYDGFNILVERDGMGNTTKSYTRGLDLGGGIGSLISQNYTVKNTPVVQYYYYDTLGSVSNLPLGDGSRLMYYSYSYDAFGNLVTPQIYGDTNRYLFSTKEFDSREGLYYFGRRYYDPEVGRWLTPDPLGMIDGVNLYIFVKNNPVNIIDPNGYFGIEGAIFGAGFGGYNGFLTGLYRGGLKGAIVGAATGATVGALVGAVVPDSPLLATLTGAAGSETANVLSNAMQGQPLFNNTTFSLASGALFGGVGSEIQIGLAAEGEFGATMASGLITTPYAVGADALDYTFDPNGTSLDNSLANLTGFGATNWAGKERE